MSGAPSWQLQQLYALWQQRQARMARWAGGTLAFAALVPVLVLGPYERTTRASAELTSRRTAADERVHELTRETQEHLAVQAELATISASLDRFAWEDRRDELRDHMRRLGADWSRVEALSAENLNDLRELKGEIDRMQSPIQAQPPNRAANAPAPSGREPVAGDRVDDLLDALSVLERLGLDPDQLAEADAPGRHELLSRTVEALADEAAAEAIDDAAREMRRSVVEPLRNLVDAHPTLTARVPTLEEAAQRTAAEVDEWEGRYRTDREWYRTVSGKGETMHSLRQAMNRGPGQLPGQPEAWTDAVRRAIAGEEERARTQIAALEAQRDESQRQATEYQAQIVLLEAKLKAILPSWLGEIVSPPELMTLYAPAVIVLLGILAASAWRVRQCYLALLGTAGADGLSLDTIAAGSTWTLARRDGAATAATGLVYLGGLALLWTLFAYGTGLSGSFAALRTSGDVTTSETLVDSLVGAPALPSLRVLGHAAFAACVAGVLLLLFGGRRVP